MKTKYKIFNSTTIKSFKKSEWDKCNELGNVFLSYNFLYLLEHSKCISKEYGWEPIYVGVKENNKLIAVTPCYLKHHSQGEFVFDHAWANAYQRFGISYYPKLLVASPFSPVSGLRILTLSKNDILVKKKIINYLKKLCLDKKISGLHINFFDESELDFFKNENFLIRYGEQFHFYNKNYSSFNDFLNSLSYKSRKKIIKERRSIKNSGIDIDIVTGEDLSYDLCEKMYNFYITTINKKWSYDYLNKDFFLNLPKYLKKESVLILARYNNSIIAGALNFLSKNTLYGRYWGSESQIKNLHFEVCYYKAIEYAINQNCHKVEAGAQGSHKISRGYSPQITYSAHYLLDNTLKGAIKKFIEEERKMVMEEVKYIEQKYSPFKVN